MFRLPKTRVQLLLVFASIAVTAAVLYIAMSPPEESWTIEMEVKVADKLAFNLDPDALRFGSVPPGSGAERGIEIKNLKAYPLRVSLFASGELSAWLGSFENNFVINSLAARNVTFFVTVPADATFGVYRGTLLVEMRRVWI